MAAKPRVNKKASGSKKGGAPTVKTDENKRKFIELVLEGHSIRAIGKMDDMPSAAVLHEMLAEDSQLAEQYTRAWALSADRDFQEIVEIADDAEQDVLPVYNESGKPAGYVQNHVKVARAKLQIDARKWVASKKAPKKYGDKITVEPGDNPFRVLNITPDMTPEEAAAAYAEHLRGDAG